MKSFEWKVNYVVEGLLPSELPKTINKECDLEKFAEGKGDEVKALLSVKILRPSIPSDKEEEEVRKIALEKAERLVNIYSLFVGRLRILQEASIEQVTPYEGKRRLSKTLPIRARVLLPGKTWCERSKFLKETETVPLENYLSLALSHYSLAQWTEPKSSFLNLMVCIEALYNVNAQEIRYRISHRVANLLGRTEKLRQRIFNDMLDLYSKRNDLVHGIKPVNVSEKDTKLLWAYSEYSLMAFLKLRPKKKDILGEIDEVIYDEERRKQIQENISDILESLEKSLEGREEENPKGHFETIN